MDVGIKQKEENLPIQPNIDPVPAETIAQAIVKIADATQAIYKYGLNEKAIILLISEASGVCKRDVKYVLTNMYHLKTKYLAQAKGTK